MCLVKNNDGTEYLEHIKQTVFDGPSLNLAFQIGVGFYQAAVAEEIITVREQTWITP